MGEGHFFGQVKLMCLNDEKLYAYCLETQKHYVENPNSTKTTLLSKHFRARVVSIIKEYTVEHIISDMKDSGGKFGMLLDSTKDVSGKHQFSVAIKYVKQCDEKGFEIKERTLFFRPIKILSGQEIYKCVESWLLHRGLEMNNITGTFQCTYIIHNQNIPFKIYFFVFYSC